MFDFCTGCEVSPTKQRLCEVSSSKSKSASPVRPVIFNAEPVIEPLPSVGQQLPTDPGITFDRLSVVGAIAGIEGPPPALPDLPLWQPYLESTSAADSKMQVPFQISVMPQDAAADIGSSPTTQPREESRQGGDPSSQSSERSVWVFCEDDDEPADEDWALPESSPDPRSARSDTGGGILKWLCQDCVDDGALPSDRSPDSVTDTLSSGPEAMTSSAKEVPTWWRCDRCCCCITSPVAAREYIAKDSGNMVVLP
mmetsp:Transcript_32374/g.59134  ORF Transcript_32374/g.59134 Transcript_32374/m.59134 type:complete len:254 (+) Transcript_32374:50-811(+)